MEEMAMESHYGEGDFENDESAYLLNNGSSHVKVKGSEECSIFKFLKASLIKLFCGLCDCLCSWRKKKILKPRTIWVGKKAFEKYPPNVIKNQKYNVFTFIPLVLFHQFKFFLNLYFLIMATSQFIPEIRVGYLYTYWGPLGFVLLVTMVREAVDDYRRFQRDKEVNCRLYKKLTTSGIVMVPSSTIMVGDLIIVEKDQRVPADMVLLRTTEKNGACFIRTDQLDGETDWKLRLAVGYTQKLDNDCDLLNMEASITAEKPQKDIHSFFGTFKKPDESVEDGLALENTLWSNTVVASGTALSIVIYTGSETRSVMNNSSPRSKVGLIDLEINQLTKLLFFAVLALSLVMMCLKGFSGPWHRYFFRFILLFSYIIPISLRVNLDLSKAFYSWTIQRDKGIPGTVVRSTTIPEELGRINYLLTDKTGTLTKNEMVFKKLHMGKVSYSFDSFVEVKSLIKTYYLTKAQQQQSASLATPMRTPGKSRPTAVTRVAEAVIAIALCHNVTPVYETKDQEDVSASGDSTVYEKTEYQASSPDEVALVSWAEHVGVILTQRDITSMTLTNPSNITEHYQILQMFPFTSESKRMGIIIKKSDTNEITFYLKGADTVMASIVRYNDWMEEEAGNMAREGFRTLVVAKKTLTEEQYHDFENRYNSAKLSIADRQARLQSVIAILERDMELLCVTGVEDKLQDNVRQTLELLRNAGIKIWMLTGDKLETATCIATSSCLVARSQSIHIFPAVKNRNEARLQLNAFRKKNDSALVILGSSLEVCLQYYDFEFMELAAACPAVICCRCSPTQKADIVRLIRQQTGKQTCAIGDGGNDVSMIQAADAGVGIVGKEGKQASLAADFSLTQFSYLGRLLLVHGRHSYKRSASLSQFVMHRGLIISIMQAIFSSVFYFSSVALYQGFLLVGYATVYTMFPVFSLVLDRDVTGEIALKFPELYKELTKGRSLSYKTFFIWVLISIYQGGAIMYMAMYLFEEEFIHIVAISFTALILTELLMVALTIRTWHYVMIIAELVSLAIYILSLVIFKNSFDPQFLASKDFFWKVIVITVVSCVPLYLLKMFRKKFSPPSYSKLS